MEGASVTTFASLILFYSKTRTFNVLDDLTEIIIIIIIIIIIRVTFIVKTLRTTSNVVSIGSY